MHVLITGSSGQIGTNLALELMRRDHEVLGVDIRSNAWTHEIPFRQIDLRENCIGHVVELIKGFNIDLLVHLAAHAKVHELVIEPSRARENIEMTFKALESARLAEIPIIFGSSREVYGDIHRHMTDESCADFVVAESPYSASKIAGEALIYSYRQCYNLPYLVFRFSNVYGRFDNDLERMERVTPLFIRRIADGKPITIFGREKVLDFTYVDDCVNGIVLAIEKIVRGELRDETINLACGQGNSLEQLVQYISASLGVDPAVTYKDSLRGEVTRYVADIGKARQLLSYEPQTFLAEGIGKTIDWWRESGSF